MPGERPTRTESIFVRSNVLPPLRPAPFFRPSHPPLIFRHLVPSFARYRPSSFPRLQINVINCLRSRYRVSIRGGTIDDDHLTGRTQTERGLRGRRDGKNARKGRALKTDAVLCDRRRFSPPLETSGDHPGILGGVRSVTKVSAESSSSSPSISALLNQLLITIVCRRQYAKKSSWINTSRFSKRRARLP